MADQPAPAKPSWQTEELEEEWIDVEEDEPSQDQANISPLANTTSDLSFTQTHGIILGNSSSGNDAVSSPVSAAGTVLVKEDVPDVPFLPQTPANAKKMVGKTFFSPLALEKMFEPPSPPMEEPMLPPPSAYKNAPAIPSRLARVYVPEQDITSDSLDGLGEADMEESAVWQRDQGEEEDGEKEDATEYEFTFAAPGLNAPRSILPASGNPTTPQPYRLNHFTPSHFPLAPVTDPRLKLFQFQYDTFTRDHLSAMVDSIAVNTPAGDSGTANSKESSPAVPPSPSDTSISRLRSAKRLKLSPASDFSGDGEALIIRPHSRVDYVGESRNLMDKIRQARDFSTMSTNISALTPMSFEEAFDDAHKDSINGLPSFAPAGHVESRATSSTYAASSRKSAYSSVQLREQAADLMAQIRNDVKSHKRLFTQDSDATPIRQGTQYDPGMDSVDSADINPINYGDDTEGLSDREHDLTDTLDLYNASLQATQDVDTRYDDTDLARSVGNMSLDSVSLMEQFPPLPIALIVSSSSTSSHASAREVVSPPRSGGSKPNYLSPHTGGFALAHPSTSARANMNPDDLNRFVSSSTASGATITSGTAPPSIVRHEARPIKLITPDSQLIPQRVGEMVFDQYLKKWVKATAVEKNSRNGGVSMRTNRSNESEDPFRDIESFPEEDSPTTPEFAETNPAPSSVDPPPNQEPNQIHEAASDTETEDAEEVELTSFSFDGNSLQAGTKPAPGHQSESALDTDSEDEGEERPVGSVAPRLQDAGPHQSTPPSQDTPPPRPTSSSGKLSTPLPPSSQTSSTLTPAVRSSTQKSTSVTPVSALKDPNRNRLQTPAHQLARKRSVSFSDGKRDGPIVGVGRNAPSHDDTTSTEDISSVSDIAPVELSGVPLDPSARSKRIAGMLEDLEDTSYDTESPSKTGSGRPHSASGGLQPLSRRQNGNTPSWLSNGGGGRGRSRRSLSQPHSARSYRFAGGSANATFLTECSFGVAHDRLVQVITDVQPFEPYWENLSAIDLSRKELDSVARLKEFLPKLDSLNLNFNQVAWLSGIPGSVRSLSVASNCLTSVTSFSHLLNLESLDISNNNIDSLRQLECLRHLRELRADGNMIDSVDGLQKMDGLVKLSLQGNDIQDIDLAGYRWTRLEMLNLSHNKLNRLKGLSTQVVPALIALNLDSNNLRELEVEGGSMVRVKILRVSNNRLQQLNAGPFPNARTLYADNNCLGPIFKAHRLTKLENLSLRNQSGRAGLSLSIQDVRDVKRLYLSGNPLKTGFISEPCYNLVYLELAACRVTSLPSDLARLLPNLRVFNLNYNFLEDVRPLQGLTRLRKLTIIGSRVKASRDFVKILRGMLDVEMLDFRMNPCTLGWYLPLLVKDVPGALQPSDDGDRRTLAGPSNSRTASSSNAATNPASAVATGKQASSLTAGANPKTRTEFNVSTRGDGMGATAKPARGTNGASKSTSDHYDGDARQTGRAIRGDAARDGGADRVDQPAQTASRATARQDVDVDPLLPPPRARSSPPRHVQQQHLQRARQDGRGTPPKQKSLLAGAGAGVTWKDLDAKFRRDLPDDVYGGRLIYRGLVMRACPRIRMLDGIEVSEKERDKAEKLLETVLDRRRPAASSVGQQQPPQHPPQRQHHSQQQRH